MAMDAREEGRAGSGTAEDIDRHHFSFPCSATTMPKPISFRDRPEYSQSYRKVRRSFERSEEHTSELPSLMRISYAVFCLKKKKTTTKTTANEKRRRYITNKSQIDNIQ